LQEYAPKAEHLSRSSEFEFELSKNSRFRHGHRRHHHHHGHHGEYGSSYGHGWNGGYGWGGGHGSHGSHGYGWGNHGGGWDEGNIGATHAFYIGKGGGGGGYGHGHGIKYDKHELKYNIFKLKAKKKIAALQTGIEVNKLISTVLQHKIKKLGWLH